MFTVLRIVQSIFVVRELIFVVTDLTLEAVVVTNVQWGRGSQDDGGERQSNKLGEVHND
jgi:hypothetical protein